MQYYIKEINGLFIVFDEYNNLIQKFNTKLDAKTYISYLEYYELLKMLMTDY